MATHGLPEGQQDLSAENVEVVGRSRAVDHDPVTVVELEHREVLRQFLGSREETSEVKFIYTFNTVTTNQSAVQKNVQCSITV